MGRRISRKVWTKTTVEQWPEESSASPTSFKKYVWDEWHMLAELNGKNNDAALVTYTWGPDLSGTFGGAGGVGGLLGISKKTVPTANLACLYDGNGNITQLVDMATGDAKAHYEYDPFGNLIQSEGVSGLQTWNKFRFSTKQIEEELLIPTTSSSAGVSPDLYYYGYRYYSPRLGRWITRDPIEEEGGENLYGFVKNQPISFCDIFGLACNVTSFSVKVEKWIVHWPSYGFGGRRYSKQLKVEFKLEIDECSDKKDCSIRQYKKGLVKIGGGITKDFPDWEIDSAGGRISWWDGESWESTTRGKWKKNGKIAIWEDRPGFSGLTINDFPCYFGGVGGVGHFDFKTEIRENLKVVREITWGLLINYQNPKSGKHYFCL